MMYVEEEDYWLLHYSHFFFFYCCCWLKKTRRSTKMLWWITAIAYHPSFLQREDASTRTPGQKDKARLRFNKVSLTTAHNKVYDGRFIGKLPFVPGLEHFYERYAIARRWQEKSCDSCYKRYIEATRILCSPTAADWKFQRRSRDKISFRDLL